MCELRIELGIKKDLRTILQMKPRFELWYNILMKPKYKLYAIHMYGLVENATH
jgi:hypothetical protein